MNFIGHDRGPGIAACAILASMLQHLVEQGVLPRDDIQSILAAADEMLRTSGETNVAVQDAREVLKKIRGPIG